MTGSLTDWSRWTDGRRPLSLATACAWLAATVLVSYPIVGGIAGQRDGQVGWIAAAVAAVTCWFASTAALVAGQRHRGPQRGFFVLLYGLAFGFAVPLVAGTVLTRLVPSLAAAGLFGLMVVFYLVTLTVGTLLSVRLLSATESQPRQSRAG